ncbi:DUF4386 domain-containing protein [Labilibaculum euxinus]|uniref:DUF4386 domain-containing protein n=1 Tax=Labilibaculum euxinus TaxID=2686357 RepID=UPI00279482A6|nr:DUF4386 domain-containing protein [Labilibaculum euxinus]MDQ1771608.1 DUF4386 domain-containing protein [Labilibaculum euxinus]
MSLIIMAIAAGFSYGYVYTSLMAKTPLATAQNLADNSELLLAGIAGWIVIISTDLIVAFSLCTFFISTNRKISMITAGIRLIYTVFLILAVYQLAAIRFIEQPTVFANDITELLGFFEQIWSFGLILFGLHLIGLGYLSIKSTHVPNVLGYLLYLGGVIYSEINIVKNSSLLDVQTVQILVNELALPMALGEMLLAVWMIYMHLKNAKPAIN